MTKKVDDMIMDIQCDLAQLGGLVHLITRFLENGSICETDINAMTELGYMAAGKIDLARERLNTANMFMREVTSRD